MKSVVICLLSLVFLAAGCAPVRTDKATEGERIVSLAPNLTEIVCAAGAGAALVGRTSACDYPPEIVKSVPVIGGFGAPSMDLLLKTRPTLIIDVDLEDEAVANLMAQMGVRRVRVPCSTLDDIPQAILAVGRLAHTDPIAQPLAERIRREIAEQRNALAKRKAAGQSMPSVFVEIWDDPLMTVGRNSFVSELVALAGGRNLGDEVTDKDYFPVAGEWVIARNPDIVLCLYMTKGDGQKTTDYGQPTAEKQKSGVFKTSPEKSGIIDRVAARAGWMQIKAVREGRVYGGFDNNLMLRPGPRVLEGIAALRERIQE